MLTRLYLYFVRANLIGYQNGWIQRAIINYIILPKLIIVANIWRNSLERNNQAVGIPCVMLCYRDTKFPYCGSFYFVFIPFLFIGLRECRTILHCTFVLHYILFLYPIRRHSIIRMHWPDFFLLSSSDV